jgi:hypothetical protein
MIDALPRTGDRDVRISVAGLRNQSHATPREFAQLQSRLAGLLGVAAAGSGVRFELMPDAAPDYRLDGAAYLATRGGFDVWELYLRLSPVDRRGIIWRWDDPVHVLRQPRPNQAEILSIPGGSGR